MSNTKFKDQIDIREKVSINGENITTINERMSAGPTKTKIILKNHDTGEVLGEFENKCLVTGGIINSGYTWGIEPPVILPTYNDATDFDNTLESKREPYNTPIVCLFGVADSGCGPTPKDVYVVKYTDRIKPAPGHADDITDFDPEMLMPFRWVDINKDINSDLRKYYFGRKTYPELGKIGYFLKSFDTIPQMHLRYADGTQIAPDMYDYPADQLVECYVETRLRVTKVDLRDYFDQVLGWDKARISTLSLFYAWYDDRIDEYKWYQDIYPYTKLNFPYQWLVDENFALDVIYQVYY